MMLYCKECKKEVVIYGVSYSVGIDDQLDQLRTQIEKEGKLISFNHLKPTSFWAL